MERIDLIALIILINLRNVRNPILHLDELEQLEIRIIQKVLLKTGDATSPQQQDYYIPSPRKVIPYAASWSFLNATPIATVNSGPATLSTSSKKAGASTCAKGLARSTATGELCSATA